MELTAEELSEIYAWVEAEPKNNLLAAAYMSLMHSKSELCEADEALDKEFDASAAASRKQGKEPEMSNEVLAAWDAMESLNDAWFEAREKLGRLCLLAMRAVG